MSETEVVYQNIDDTELQRYAAVVLDDQTLTKHNLSDHVMTRKSKYGQKHKITGVQKKTKAPTFFDGQNQNVFYYSLKVAYT